MTDKQKLAIKRLELNKNTEIYIDYKTKEKTDDIEVVLDLLKEDKNVKEQMTIEQAQEILDELQRAEPELLNNEAKKLFEAIMKIADERDELKEESEHKDKIIDLIAEQLAGLILFDIDKDKPIILYDKEDVKQYFENKAKEKIK